MVGATPPGSEVCVGGRVFRALRSLCSLRTRLTVGTPPPGALYGYGRAIRGGNSQGLGVDVADAADAEVFNGVVFIIV